MARYYFDIETDGLLPEMAKIHCIVLQDVDTGKVIAWWGDSLMPLEEAIEELQEADEIIGHNIIGFDIPAIQKLYPDFMPKGKVTDTLVLSRLVFPDIKGLWAYRMRKVWKTPVKLMYSHSLEAWGHRLGVYKGDFAKNTDWKEFSPEMLDYCEQDVVVTKTLYEYLRGSKGISEEAEQLEHAVAWIIARQERRGFRFNVEKAVELYSKLVAERDRLNEELQRMIRPWYQTQGVFTPKRDNQRMGYGEGARLTKVKLVEFNPNSEDHIASRLKKLRKWKPTKFTDTGKPSVTEEVLKSLPWPEAKLCAEYMTVQKRIGQVAEGKEAWLIHERNGRIHGAVNPIGAVTGRMAHFKPNLAQVPASYSPWGKECRELFIPSEGMVLVGCDASGLELRDLAGYMAPYDDGAYIEAAVSGQKEEGTDIHSLNAKALGTDRDTAKTWFYAFIYGAGNAKLGAILKAPVKPDVAEKFPRPAGNVKSIGLASRKRFAENLPALAVLANKVKDKARKKGYVRGLDGRRIYIRSEHSALNTLLQGCGAIQMKKALVLCDASLQLCYTPGVDYEFVANVHDEWQIEALPHIAEDVGRIAVASIKAAGEHFGFRCPLDGEYAVGNSWAETH